jgi:hypothetical protein
MVRKKSTGPKTDKGKRRVSQNALKSGVYSRNIVLPSENEADFQMLHQRFIDDFKPQDIVGAQLVHDMSVVVWKRMRLERIENKVLTDILNAPIREEEAVGTVYLWRPEVAVMVGAMHLLTDDYLKELDIALQHAFRFQEEGLGEEEICKLAKSIPALDGMLNLKYPDYELTPSYKLLGSHPQILRLKLGPNPSFQEILAAAIKEMRENQWLCAHRDGILKEYEVVRNRRLIQFMENAGTSRAFDDLRRSLSKLLAEYRKHEEWRNERAMLDMGMAENAPS